jgi:hypothetical protein
MSEAMSVFVGEVYPKCGRNWQEMFSEARNTLL